MEIYTMGFTHKSAEQFFGILRDAGIKRLIDIRLSNSSQLAGFTKQEDLRFFLAELCQADYVHRLDLAPTPEIMAFLKKQGGPWPDYERRMLALFAERHIEKTVPRDLFDVPAVLLCSEATAGALPPAPGRRVSAVQMAQRSHHAPMSRLRRVPWLRLALIGGVAIAGCGVALGADIYAYSSRSDRLPADAAIVLGAAAWNGKPSPVFAERINHAIDLYKQGRVKTVIFTGGKGGGELFAESIAGSNYALERGVAAQDMFCETTSRITLENLQGARVIIDQQHIGRILIVSDPLHMRRSLTMAHDLGINAYPSPTPTSRYTGAREKLRFLLRETYFYALYLAGRQFAHLAESGWTAAVQRCQ